MQAQEFMELYREHNSRFGVDPEWCGHVPMEKMIAGLKEALRLNRPIIKDPPPDTADIMEDETKL
jgi:hypothetical protein